MGKSKKYEKGSRILAKSDINKAGIKNVKIKNVLRKITEASSGTERQSHAYPDNEKNLLKWVEEDPNLRAALESKHDVIVNVGYYFVGNKRKSNLSKLDKLRFYRWHDDSWWQELIYANSFTELSRDSSDKITRLSIIKTDEVEILNTDTGIVRGYLQIPSNPESTRQVIQFKKDDIVHISGNHLNAGLWGDSVIPTLFDLLKSKRMIQDFINWLFESNQFRSTIKIPDHINDEDVDIYLNMLKNGMRNPTNFLVLQGNDAEIGRLRELDEFKDLIGLLNYYTGEILATLQIPPLQAGIIEGTNRSSAEYQIRYNFYTHIRSLMKRKQDEINKELFPRLGITDMELRYELIDEVNKKNMLDMGQKLVAMGADRKMLNKWLIDNGINIPENMLKEEEEFMQTSEPSLNKRLKLDKNSDLHPSRNKTQMDFAGGSRKT